jgi:hypothetical protein
LAASLAVTEDRWVSVKAERVRARIMAASDSSQLAAASLTVTADSLLSVYAEEVIGRGPGWWLLRTATIYFAGCNSRQLMIST